MRYWKLINRHEFETLSARVSTKKELVESLDKCSSGLPKWAPFVILRDLADEGAAIPVNESADWALNEAIDFILKNSALPKEVADGIRHGLKRTLQKGLAGYARAFARFHISTLLKGNGATVSKRIRAGSEDDGELSAAEAEMVTRLLSALERTMQKDGHADAEVFKAFLDGSMLDYVSDLLEYEAYRSELSDSKRMHAELQVLRMLLSTHLLS